MGGSDVASQAGKAFVELEHARAKEGLARSALNRRCAQCMPFNLPAIALCASIQLLTAWCRDPAVQQYRCSHVPYDALMYHVRPHVSYGGLMCHVVHSCVQ